jgi:hypothetical protein
MRASPNDCPRGRGYRNPRRQFQVVLAEQRADDGIEVLGLLLHLELRAERLDLIAQCTKALPAAIAEEVFEIGPDFVALRRRRGARSRAGGAHVFKQRARRRHAIEICAKLEVIGLRPGTVAHAQDHAGQLYSAAAAGDQKHRTVRRGLKFESRAVGDKTGRGKSRMLFPRDGGE